MRYLHTPAVVAIFVMLTAGCVPATQAEPVTLEDLNEKFVQNFQHNTIGGHDDDGYGAVFAWGLSYQMMTLNLLYEVTGNTQYIDTHMSVAEQVLNLRDVDLADEHGRDAYVDYQRDRVMPAWGTGNYSGGKHTCWAVHAGMIVFPLARLVRLVREGGEDTRPYVDRANSFIPKLKAAMDAFDDEWRAGPEEGMGYYIFPNGNPMPLNQQNAPGRAFFALSEITDEPKYLQRAQQLAAFMKTQLTHIEDGDYYLWRYGSKPGGQPGTGEDISHGAINAHFVYLAWRHDATFTDTDMQRLTRTFSECLYLGDGRFRGALNPATTSTKRMSAIARWTYLAQFDPLVRQQFLEFVSVQLEGDAAALNTTLESMAYGYLKRAQQLRSDAAEE